MSTKLLTKAILEKAHAFKWSIQGFGMLRLYLSAETRLHVWDDRYRVAGVSDVHDHPWDFESEIVAGEVRQHRYTVRPSATGGWQGSALRCGMGAQLVGHLVGDADAFDLEEHPEEHYRAGDRYVQHRSEVHRSMPARGTVTIVARRFSADVDRARVFWPRGTGWISAEPREATPAEVGDVIGASLARWFA